MEGRLERRVGSVPHDAFVVAWHCGEFRVQPVGSLFTFDLLKKNFELSRLSAEDSIDFRVYCVECH